MHINRKKSFFRDFIASGHYIAPQSVAVDEEGFHRIDAGSENDRTAVEVALLRRLCTVDRIKHGANALALDIEFQESFIRSRRITEDGYVSRAAVIGCSGALVNEQVYAMTDIQQFIIRTAEFLLDLEATDLDILAKEAVRPALGTGSIGLGSVLLAALPAAVLLTALLVLLRRRSK